MLYISIHMIDEMYVYIYIYIYTCICIYDYSYVYIYIYIYIYLYIYIYILYTILCIGGKHQLSLTSQDRPRHSARQDTPGPSEEANPPVAALIDGVAQDSAQQRDVQTWLRPRIADLVGSPEKGALMTIKCGGWFCIALYCKIVIY